MSTDNDKFSFYAPLEPGHVIINSSSTWIMKIDIKTGVMLLNPEVPQEQAIYDFAAALNHWVSAYRDLTTEK